MVSSALLGLALATSMVGLAICAHADADARALLDEFAAVDWAMRARPIVPDASDTAWRTRVRIEHALIGMGPAAVPDLIVALDHPDRHVRALAAFCLGAIGDTSAAPALVRSLSRDRAATVRLHAVEALGRLGDRAALPAIEAATDDSSRWVAGMARLARQRLMDGAAVGDTLRAMAQPAEAFTDLTTPAVGTPAPDFDLLTHRGERVRLSDYRTQRPVVLVFALANW